ncbi:MAG: ABC transporter ATP-binding protein [Planctomycetes bacterium]|nr:ABC transporter ATP-binding protein [Planctomycetota bacterium]
MIIRNSNTAKVLQLISLVIRRYPWACLRFSLAYIFISLASAMSMGVLQPIINNMMNEGASGDRHALLRVYDVLLSLLGLQVNLTSYLTLFVGSFGITALLHMLVEIDKGIFFRSFDINLRKQILSTTLCSPWEALRSMDHGNFINMIHIDANNWRSFVNVLFILVSGVLQGVVYAGMIFWIEWRVGLAAILFLTGGAALLLPLLKWSNSLGRRGTNCGAGMMGILNAITRGFKTIKAMSLEKASERKVDYFLREYAQVQFVTSSFLQPLMRRSFEFYQVVVLAGLIAICINTWGIGPDVLLVIVAMLFRYNSIINEINGSISSLYAVVPSIDKIEKMKRYILPERQECVSGRIDELHMEQVSYGYGANELFRPLTQTFKRGELWAIIGPTGSGKTTLLDLLSGIATPVKGQVLVGGRDLAQIKIESLHSQVSYATQDAFLFTGSLHENLSFGLTEQVDLTEATRIAQLGDLLGERGLDSRICESGQDLSGGQKQRIALARALARQGSFLLMDEPTSALDRHTEEAFLDQLAAACRGRVGVIMVIHREAWLRHADHILELREGNWIKTTGKHSI